MQSAIAICNVALTTYLGSRTITAFEDTSPEAEQCKLHYDRIRLSLLERWPGSLHPGGKSWSRRR